MGGDVNVSGFGNTDIDPGKHQQVAALCADRIVARYPDLPGRRIAHDPTARADVLDLLDAIGYLPAQQGEHVTTATTLPPTAVADAAEKAAEIVCENGLHKGYLYDEAKANEGLKPAECPVDAIGAINTAVFGQPCWPAESHPGSLLAQAVALALQETVGKPVPGWNDEPERTADDVLTRLLETAARLREAK